MIPQQIDLTAEEEAVLEQIHVQMGRERTADNARRRKRRQQAKQTTPMQGKKPQPGKRPHQPRRSPK